MPRTSIKVSNVINASSKATSAKSKVSGTKNGTESTRCAIDSRILNRNNINGRLVNVKNSIWGIERDIAEIYTAINNGAMKYQEAENRVVAMGQGMGSVYIKPAPGQENTVAQRYDSYFHEVSLEEREGVGSQLTEEQREALLGAIKDNDMVAALHALGIENTEEMSEEDFNLLKDMWDNSWGALGDTVNDASGVTGAKDAISGIEWDIFTAALESSGPNITKLAGWINTVTAVAHGPQAANSFVIVNPQVASKTASMASVGNKLTTAMNSTAAKVGVPIIGGIIDFGIMVYDGEEVGDAAIKATAHVGIGLAGGALGTKIGAVIGGAIGSVFPGVGTVAVGAIGAVVGFVAGVAITTVGNAIFDTVYDNWDNITAWADEKGQQIMDGLDTAKEWALEKGAEALDAAGKAIDATVDWVQEKGAEALDAAGKAIDATVDWVQEKGTAALDAASATIDAVGDWAQEKGEQVKDFFGDIGDAVSGGWNLLGGIFG